MIELAQLEVVELFESAGIEAPVLPVSGTTGEGVEDLVQALGELASNVRSIHPDHGIARLPVDRAFVLKGIGVVATGTLWSGEIHPGDTLYSGVGSSSAGARRTEPRASRRRGPRRGPHRAGPYEHRSVGDRPGRCLALPSRPTYRQPGCPAPTHKRPGPAPARTSNSSASRHARHKRPHPALRPPRATSRRERVGPSKARRAAGRARR